MRSPLASPLRGFASPFGTSSGGGAPTPTSPNVLDVTTGGVSSASPTEAAITIPATANTGDIMLFFAASRNSADVISISGGAGAPVKVGEVDSSVGSSYSLASFHYTVNAGDTPGTTQLTLSSTQAFQNFSVAAITVANTSGIDNSAAPQQIGGFGTNARAPAVTTSVGDDLIVFAVGAPTTGTYSDGSGTYTEETEATIGSAGLAVYSFVQAAAGTTGTLSVTATDAAYNYGATFALSI